MPRHATFICAIGSVLIAWGSYSAFQQIQIQQWPTIEAKVILYGGLPINESNTPLFDVPCVTFQYEYEGNIYQSNRIMPSPLGMIMDQECQLDRKKTDVGSIVKCAVNPNQPAVAYLLNDGLTATTILVLYLGLVFIVGALDTIWQSQIAQTKKRMVWINGNWGFALVGFAMIYISLVANSEGVFLRLLLVIVGLALTGRCRLVIDRQQQRAEYGWGLIWPLIKKSIHLPWEAQIKIARGQPKYGRNSYEVYLVSEIEALRIRRFSTPDRACELAGNIATKTGLSLINELTDDRS